MSRFDIQKMASGGLALVLEPRSKWSQFPKYSEKWIKKLNGHALGKPVISADECLVEVRIDNGDFWITYDDFQSSIQLEPKDIKYNDIILSLQKRLRGNT